MAPEGQRGSRAGRGLWTAFRLVVCVVLLVVVLGNVDADSLHTVLRNLDPVLAVGALAAFVPVPLLQALRLVWMMRIQGMKLGYRPSVRIAFAGNVLNWVLIGSTGGDVYKAWVLARATQSRRTEVVTTVFLDRVVGLGALLLVAGTAVLLHYRDPRIGGLEIAGGVELGPAFASLLGLGLFGLLVYAHPAPRRWLRLGAHLDRLPLGRTVRRVDAAVHRAVRRPRWLLSAIGLTVLIHLVSIVVAWLAAGALGMSSGLAPYLVYVPLGFVVWALPISIGGLGTLDAWYEAVAVAARLGSVEQGFCLAWMVRLIQLAWSLPGIFVFLAGEHRPGRGELESFLESS